MHTLRTAILLTVTLLIVSLLHAQSQPSRLAPAHIGFIYPLSTNGAQAGEYTNNFSIHIVAGVSKAETGFALAGVSLIIKDSASGVQIAGFSNHIAHSAHGVQLAGFLNQTGSSDGVSIAGFANISRDSAGVQLAGFINKARNVNSQIGGFINIAKNVKGVQLAGFINIADSSEYPIALLNFIKNGERSIGLSTDETFTTLLTFRSGGKKLYTLIGAGYNNKDGNELFAWQAGFGIHTRITENFRINTEAVTTGMTDFKREDYFRATLRSLPSLRFARRLEIFAGPGINYIRTERGVGTRFVTKYLWSEHAASGIFHGLYIGVHGGINVML